MTEAVVRSVERFAPDRIVLLPLYPQFSTTTTGSSFKAWNAAAARSQGADRSRSRAIRPSRASSAPRSSWSSRAWPKPEGTTRVLFSAHGLPEKIIKAGDPYQRQVEQTAAAIAEHLGGSSTARSATRAASARCNGSGHRPSGDRRAGADKVAWCSTR